ncbi:periplasmic heavy metal sensor [Flavobacterium sp. GT3R68]|uniref:periplasmic heavy metal sensor n=1 Tax=Flavobacterium sp. GT3R68 TaxID=2594437 RepID=UPI000F860DEA|nr:periplasmic heavy metal sensor [Flavobacterium sp. GT3R68]RTY93686.1 periplasmic heavy metal sensor [Flavobacterium sp. GSN2]TRW91592.1 periplasmic heavy metal sensor [Flavobacterium sp. GT3R68]
MMDKTKLLTLAVIGLLLLNLATMGFLFLNNPKGHGGPGNRPKPQEIIIMKLHLDDKQQESYQQLIQWHRSQIDDFDYQIREAKNKLYLELVKSTIDIKVKDSLIDEIANYQKKIEITHFKHFQDIKKLCRKEQLKDYDVLTEELSKIFSHPPKPKDD